MLESVNVSKIHPKTSEPELHFREQSRMVR